MRLLIIGAGGHSKEVADLIAACGHELVGFVDESYTGSHSSTRLPVVDRLELLSYDGVVLAIGDCVARERWFTRLCGETSVPTLIHPTAVISPSATIGAGVQLMQNVVVNAEAVVGDDCIVNVAACLSHDCVVGPHSHVAPGVQMSGGSTVGEGCVIGTNATLLPGVKVGRRCVVGAGAVVTRDILETTTVVGVPARPVATGEHSVGSA